MAVFQPDPTHLAEQFASLAAQTHRLDQLVVVIADTVSEDLVAQCNADHGLPLSLVIPTTTSDSIRAFEQGLTHALTLYPDADAHKGPNSPLIALCDQDDIWHPNRLERGVAALQTTGAALVHSDARLVADDGTSVLHKSMFAFEKRHPSPGLRGLLYRNNITGMTCLMRLELVAQALPFPAQNGVHFHHDLWLGLMAQATGRGVYYLPEALVDYRQHGHNVIGAVDRQKKSDVGVIKQLRTFNIRQKAAPYALARYLAHCTKARINTLVQTGQLQADQAQTQPLKPFLKFLRGGGAHLWDATLLGLRGRTGLARIAGSFALVSAGRSAWALRTALTKGLSHAIANFDTRLYSLSPGLPPPTLDEGTDPATTPKSYTSLQDQRKQPGWSPDFNAPHPAVCVLVPSLNPTEMFAGIVSAIDLGVGLATRGIPVRFIATDAPVSSREASFHFLQQRLTQSKTKSGKTAEIDLQCGVQNDTLSAHPDDQFLATAWWTAHCADTLIKTAKYNTPEFMYLIQDHEPHFYPWGQEFADASNSYDLQFRAIFNTTLLRDYFASLGYAFAQHDTPQTTFAFHPAIEISTYANGHRPTRTGPRRLAIYGRPSVARNMLASTVEALAIFITEQSLTSDDIELISVGEAHPPITLPNGLTLKSFGKLPLSSYPDFLASIDLGLSLMYSPHPSHPPIEMAAAGARVVTNSFGQKDLSLLSSAILSSTTASTDLAQTLAKAWTMGPVTQAERNIDLTQIGAGLDDMLDQLAASLRPSFPKVERH
jgi:hypothetical protein